MRRGGVEGPRGGRPASPEAPAGLSSPRTACGLANKSPISCAEPAHAALRRAYLLEAGHLKGQVVETRPAGVVAALGLLPEGEHELRLRA